MAVTPSLWRRKQEDCYEFESSPELQDKSLCQNKITKPNTRQKTKVPKSYK